MRILLAWLAAASAALAGASPAPGGGDAGLDPSLIETLAFDDECFGDGEQCALDAFQLRASRLRHDAAIAAEEAKAEGAVRLQGGALKASGVVGVDDDSLIAGAVAAHRAQATQTGFAVAVADVAAATVSATAPAAQAVPVQAALAAEGEKDAGTAGETSTSSLLMALSFSVGLASASLVACATYDGIARRRHAARFMFCRTDVQRVQQVLLKGEGEVPLCPYCLEYIHNTWLKSKVVFICGHGFHLDCANKCLSQAQFSAGACPLCAEASAGPLAAVKPTAGGAEDDPERTPEPSEDPEDKDDESLESKSGSPGLPGEASCQGNSCGGGGAAPAASAVEVRSFMLNSLHRKHADIISLACAERWATCHIETWLSELARPAFSSVFRWRGGS